MGVRCEREIEIQLQRERETTANGEWVAGGVRTPTNFPWAMPALAMSLESGRFPVRRVDSVFGDGFTGATAASGQRGRVTLTLTN